MDGPQATVTSMPLQHSGRSRPYLLRVPPACRGRACALVLELHGRGIDPLTFDKMTGLSRLADEAGFVLAMPRATAGIWNDGRYGAPAFGELGVVDDVGYLHAVIDDARSRAAIDDARIYLVGMSNGATMAGRLACERPDPVAAIAQVSGTVPADVSASCRPEMSLVSIHGTRDRFIPYGGGRARGLAPRIVYRKAAAPSLGVEAWAEQWVSVNDAAVEPERERLAADVTLRRWHSSSGTRDAVFIRVERGGHTWPGSRPFAGFVLGRTCRTVDATRLVWDFLESHTRGA